MKYIDIINNRKNIDKKKLQYKIDQINYDLLTLNLTCIYIQKKIQFHIQSKKSKDFRLYCHKFDKIINEIKNLIIQDLKLMKPYKWSQVKNGIFIDWKENGRLFIRIFITNILKIKYNFIFKEKKFELFIVLPKIVIVCYNIYFIIYHNKFKQKFWQDNFDIAINETIDIEKINFLRII